MEIKKTDTVRKSEILVKARYKMSGLAIKFITLIIAEFKTSDDVDKKYILKVKNFMELSGLSYKNLYNYLNEASQELLRNPLHIPKNKGFLNVNWISSAEYKEGEGFIEFKIDSKLRPYIADLKQRFLKYRIENILRLRSGYIIRIYEILKDWYNSKNRYNGGNKVEKIIELKWLRETLEIPPSYQYSSGIKERMLLKAQKELKKYTDIWFEFKEIKTGRKITHIKFVIYSKNDKEKKKITQTQKNIPENILKLAKQQPNIGAIAVIIQALKKHDEEYVISNIKYANEHAHDNYSAYLTKSLNKDYAGEYRAKEKQKIANTQAQDEYKKHIGKKITIQEQEFNVTESGLINIETNSAIPLGDIIKKWDKWKKILDL